MNTNLQSKKEKLMQEAKEILETRTDIISEPYALSDFEYTLDKIKDVIDGNRKFITDEEKTAEVWKYVMELFDNLH